MLVPAPLPGDERVVGGATALTLAMVSRGESFDRAAVLPQSTPHPSPLPKEREPVVTKTPPSKPPLRKGGKLAAGHNKTIAEPASWVGPVKAGRRRGLSLIEFLVIFAIFSLVLLVLLMFATRGREEARLVSCRMNLGRSAWHWPCTTTTTDRFPWSRSVAALDQAGPNGVRPPSPLRTLLETFQLPDLTGLRDPNTVSPARPGPVPGEMPVRGFVCPSDPIATGGLLRRRSAIERSRATFRLERMVHSPRDEPSVCMESKPRTA